MFYTPRLRADDLAQRGEAQRGNGGFREGHVVLSCIPDMSMEKTNTSKNIFSKIFLLILGSFKHIFVGKKRGDGVDWVA